MWMTSGGKLSLSSVHLLMWSLCTVVTLRSVLQPRYVALRPGFVPWCGFPGSPLKGQSWPLFCIFKKMTKDIAPRRACCYQFWKSPLSSSQCVCVTGEKKRWWWEEGVWGSRQQKIPHTCPGIPGMLSEFPDLLVWPHLAAACLQPCMQRCAPKRIFIHQVKDPLFLNIYIYTSLFIHRWTDVTDQGWITVKLGFKFSSHKLLFPFTSIWFVCAPLIYCCMF